MTHTAYLRVYQPVSEIGGRAEEHEAWLASADEEAHEGSSLGWLIRKHLPTLEPLPGPIEGAFVRRVDGRVLVCPWRTRLRMLAALLAFRGSVPDEVADAFVPENEAHRAAHELALLEENHPEIRNHIIHANWHVPLRWFAAFADPERILTEDRHGLRIRYEASLKDANARLARALEILENSWIEESVTGSVRELHGWLEEFGDDGILELDYGSVASLFGDEELLEDRSVADVWTCLDSLESGDVVRAGQTFGELTERWSEIRALEVAN